MNTAIPLPEHAAGDIITYETRNGLRRVRISNRNHKDGEPTYDGHVLPGSTDDTVCVGDLVWCYEHQVTGAR